jgi:hypothetical protein
MENANGPEVAMIHAYKDDMTRIPRIKGSGIEGMTGYVKSVTDGGQEYLMILVPYPHSCVQEFVSDLSYHK